MGKTIPVFCTCGKAVPLYLYCYACRQIQGSPNCPGCARPVCGIKVMECLGCNPADADRIKENALREYYGKGNCPAGDCVIPVCPTCKESKSAVVWCGICGKQECSPCSTLCERKFIGHGRKVDSTVSYSDTGSRYPRDMKRQRDTTRPEMFVESWEYKKGQCIKRTLVGFEKKGKNS